MRGDRQNRNARAVTVEQPIDQVQVARAAAAGADCEVTCEMRLGAGREGGDLLMTDMQPLDLPLPANGIGNAVEAVADDAIDASHTDRGGALPTSYAPNLKRDKKKP